MIQERGRCALCSGSDLELLWVCWRQLRPERCHTENAGLEVLGVVRACGAVAGLEVVLVVVAGWLGQKRVGELGVDGRQEVVFGGGDEGVHVRLVL